MGVVEGVGGGGGGSYVVVVVVVIRQDGDQPEITSD